MSRDLMTGGVFPATETGNAAAKISLSPGFRFHPTNEELVSFYLKRKVLGKPCFDAIGEVDITKHEPNELPEYSKLKTRDSEWYFFSKVDKRYCTGTRLSRATNTGYWKTTAKDTELRGGKDELIGIMKTLVFYTGRAPNVLRTNWVIHEYHLVETNEAPQVQQGAYVLCKLFQKDKRYAAFLEDEWEEWDGENVRVMEDHVPIVVDANGSNETQQGNQSQRKYLIDINELPKEFEIDNDSITEYHHDNNENDDGESLKSEYVAEALPLCILNTEAPLPLVQYKRKRRSASTENSNNSSQTTQDHYSSTTNITSSAAIDAVPLELSLMGCSDKKKNLPLKENTSEADATMLPAASSPTKLINDLQKDSHQIVVEKEKLKLDLMYAEIIINLLQGKINALREENEVLRKNSSSNNKEQCSYKNRAKA